MVDFSKLPKYADFVCDTCGQQDKGPEGQTTCAQCDFYRTHPEMAPGYFTWTRTAHGWAATATWRDKDPDPAPGTVITVHRKDGTSSQHSVSELLSIRYDTSGNRVVTVQVH